MAVYKPTYRDPKNPEELKNSAVWWYHFSFAGRRIQESSKSTRKTIAVEAEKLRRLELERAYAGIPTVQQDHRVRTVKMALVEYQTAYVVNHRLKAVAWLAERANHLYRILGNAMLPDLT